ncbi:MAG: HAD-IC family P-type ATPase, partial [Gemmataceae bacterium]
HPLARLLVEEAGRRSLPLEKLDDFTAHPGSGVTARIAGKTVRVGNVRFLQKEGLTLPGDFEERLEQWDGKGQTVLWVAVEDRIIGAVGARDQIRPGARKVIEELRQCGIQRFAILTGDRSAVARSVGSQLGIDEVRAELLPQQKAEFIAEWAKCDPPLAVAMIGDGLNDAPALAQARVGLAIGGSGTDLAAEAGDVVLMIGPDQAVGNPLRDPLRHIPLLLRLSRETVRIIRQNIVIFAFVVNLLGIVLTAWLWPAILPAQWHESGPIAAVIYHQIGSLLVLLNSMRLLWFEREGVLSSSSWSYRFRSANDWLESRFNVDGVLHWLEHFWREAAWGGMALALLVWLLSGINTIQLDEVGVVRRFGKIAGEDLTPGLHFRWPWPIETVTRLQPEKVRVVELGFRRMQGSRSVPGARSWSSVHSDGFNRELDEAVMLTGDGNLLEVQGSLRYVIDDARRYLFSAADTDFTLRNAAESVIREIVASKSMADLLTRDRARFQEDVLRNLLPRCQVMNLG